MLMTPESKKQWLAFAIGLVWFYILLWPLMGIKPEGVTWGASLAVWIRVALVALVIFVLYQINKAGALAFFTRPVSKGFQKLSSGVVVVPTWIRITIILAGALIYPQFTTRYAQDIAINVMVYVCLGLGLNVVIGLCGLLDLGYIAFYGVGAYTYALLSVHFGLSFWLALPVCAVFAAISGCIIGYPTLRMRGDYLAIVTLGFGEIVRIILNNWMSLTNGPNGILGVKPPGIYWFTWSPGFGFEHILLKKLEYLYYIIFGLVIVTIISVHRLNYSRVGRAWEAIREDETAAELMGVNTFLFKLLAYAMGAVFAGLAGAFFAARMRFVSPESFTFIESAMVLSMVILGGMGSIPGIILGALALIALPEAFRQFELYRMLAFGGVMVLIMLFRPSGLWPAKRMGRRGEEKD
jgi:branched-chain amino acid transport system permease protein